MDLLRVPPEKLLVEDGVHLLGPLHVLVHQADGHEEVPLVAEDGPGEEDHEADHRRVLKVRDLQLTGTKLHPPAYTDNDYHMIYILPYNILTLSLYRSSVSSRSGSSSDFLRFPDPGKISESDPNYFKHVGKSNQHKKEESTNCYPFKLTFHSISVKAKRSKQIIPDPGKSSGSNRIRIHNTGQKNG